MATPSKSARWSARGPYYVVVDGLQQSDNGSFNLQVDCEHLLSTVTPQQMSFGDPVSCGVVIDFDPFYDGGGVWTYDGWLHGESNRNYNMLRVDGNQTYNTSPTRSECSNRFSRTSSWVDDTVDVAVTYWRSPEAEVTQTVYGNEVDDGSGGSCCGVRVDTKIRNVDSVPHYFEFRQLMATDFGFGQQFCPSEGSVEGGTLHVDPFITDFTREQELSCDGISGRCAVNCSTPVELKSADDFETKLIVQNFGPSTPDDVRAQWVSYYLMQEPCDGDEWLRDFGAVPEQPLNDCNSVNGLVYVHRFPGGTGTDCAQGADCLAPGEERTVNQFFGNGCRLNPSCTNCLATTRLEVPQSKLCLTGSETINGDQSDAPGCTGTLKYSWEVDGQPDPNVTSAMPVDAQSLGLGKHTYTLTTECDPPPVSGECKDSRTATLEVFDCTTCSVEAEITPVTLEACVGRSVRIDSSSSPIANCPGRVRYTWARDGIPIPGEDGPVLLANEPVEGQYLYSLLISCDPPPIGLSCFDVSPQVPITFISPNGGETPDDIGNTLMAWKTDNHVSLEWADPQDGDTQTYDTASW